jgi:hypothetical protein
MPDTSEFDPQLTSILMMNELTGKTMRIPELSKLRCFNLSNVRRLHNCQYSVEDGESKSILVLTTEGNLLHD